MTELSAIRERLTAIDSRLARFELVPRLVELCADLTAKDRVAVQREFLAWSLLELASVLDEEVHETATLIAGLEEGLRVIANDIELRRALGGHVADEPPGGAD